MFTIYMFFGKMKAFADFCKIVYLLAEDACWITEMFNTLRWVLTVSFCLLSFVFNIIFPGEVRLKGLRFLWSKPQVYELFLIYNVNSMRKWFIFFPLFHFVSSIIFAATRDIVFLLGKVSSLWAKVIDRERKLNYIFWGLNLHVFFFFLAEFDLSAAFK